MRRSAIVSVGLALCLLGACSDAPRGDSSGSPALPTSSAPPSPASTPTSAPTPTASPTATATTEPARRVSPDDVRVATAVAAVEHLAGRVGPRPGTSAAYRRAAGWVQGRFEELGWTVERQAFRTPAGVSWGVPVRAGRSTNVVATRGDVRSGRPWLLVGAHLDTVPQAPGAEDNASGVGVLLAVAEALAERRTRMPVVLVAFGSEEPRGPSDDEHHYGSRAYVAGLSTAERGSLNGMVSLDRVGVGSVLPVGSAGEGDPVQRQLLAAAERAGVPTVVDTEQRSSDHWSFVRAGLPGARLGSTPYAAYHSANDVPAVVSRDQLRRTARTVVSWLR
ncbi:M28 family metallopeptidase [Nocardioides abyssi]|uniref:M20/M25/M40 family metallo-hydrolase n=1 Tax=Nocardioides abyssi TaxID=3058370 RepID=A0ABT8ES05_9ACTN|nr:M28 family peptidase [Nocardioides abyssi]MDN4160796.1 M20/M25/M40 family metallo-hydrolase [Nocardioides abyssi]